MMPKKIVEIRERDRRALRLLYWEGRWQARPSQPFRPFALLIDGAPPGAWLRVLVNDTPLLEASSEGHSASIFSLNAFERTSSLFNWPEITPTEGIVIEVRAADSSYITKGIEITLFGWYYVR